MMSELSWRKTDIPGLLVLELEKIRGAGHQPRDGGQTLETHLTELDR